MKDSKIKKDVKAYINTSYWKEEGEDILFFNYSPQIEIDITIARELVRSRLEYTEGKSMLTLIDPTNLKSITKEARDFMSSPEGGLKGIIAGAFLSNNILTTTLINLYLRITRPSVPAKFFTNKEEALCWLYEIKASKKSGN